MIRKLLVANRGEIAVRAFRAAYELGIETVAVYPWEDRGSMHRQKASEAYEIGERGRPVHAYLDAGEMVRVALESGADAIYPGYGFLAENPALAEACADAGLVFVGPSAEVLRLTGNKVHALAAAQAAGLPVLRRSGELGSAGDAAAAAAEIGFPLFVKAASGGGGRGMRRVEEAGTLAAAVEAAMREAQTAFGDATLFLEEALTGPRHVEVQLLGDASGDVVHLFERDCSIQRRHQKVVEIAPAPGLDPALRDALCRDAVLLGKAIGYANAGTVEFLVDPASGRRVFIELNPRIQVEHTVTEETTDVDLVRAQLRLAGGETLASLGLTQERIVQRGSALQCRITTEDPANDFRPDTGRISVYRSPGGAGIRLDGGTTYAGAEVSGYFDSLLVKLTCRGPDLETAVARARRALAEFRIRGVATNLAFLQAVLAEPDFVAGAATTAFVDERPHLLRPRPGGDRATRLVSLVADRTVNRPHGTAPTLLDPRTKLPSLPDGPPPAGSRDRLRELGAAAFARELRARPALAVTDTTLRDAHQSLLATRLRTFDMVAAAPHLARLLPELWSAECWGGATFDVALRFLDEDPWERLGRLREELPGLLLQMLLRGRNTVGYTPYPDRVCRAFVEEAAATGIDVFRIFDALNDVGQMRPAIEAAIETGALVEGCLCYTGDLASPTERLYTLDYYLRLAERIAATGAHVLCIKDMAGLLRAPAARLLVAALRERFEQPVHLHTHDTAGASLATYLAAVDAGVDAVDGAAAPLAGMTSQPSLAAIVAATDGGERETGLSLEALNALEPYWQAVRRLYAPFEMGLDAPTGTVYRHEIPGGQLSNLRAQAQALGLGDRFEEVEELYAAADRILGRLVKVTPSSKVVGDLALALAGAGADPAELEGHPERFDLPASVVGFLAGELGTPPGGFPEPFRTRALAGRAWSPPDAELTAAQEESLAGPARRAALNDLLFPGPAREQHDACERHGDVSVLPTRLFLYGLERGCEETVDLGPGVRLILELETVGEPDERGIRTVLVRVNGQTRPFDVHDRSVTAAEPAAERADPGDPGHVAAPYAGAVTVTVSAGDEVEAGQPLATIEAMKMESAIGAPIGGVVTRLAVQRVAQVQPGDLLLVISPTAAG
ncbi:MAG: pyruvate carboxylase [Thermoleophilia bacterium]|nr:pyruvate carboxylase [Thermoleophilia bacterium]